MLQEGAKIRLAKNATGHDGAAFGNRRRWLRYVGSLTVVVALIAISGLALTSLAIQFIGPPPMEGATGVSKIVVDKNGELLRAYTTGDGRWRLPISNRDVDQRYLKILYAFEDKRFFEHGGVDLYALARAGRQLLVNGRIISGASTLTMQAARLLSGTHERTAMGKLRQVVHARYLERHFSKLEILDFYLRLAPFGGNIEGVRAASLTYFGKEPHRLSIGQAALLVALPQSPEARRPDRHPSAAKLARDRVIDRAAKRGVISKAEAARAKTERVPTSRRPFPILAPHLSDAVIAQDPTRNVHELTVVRDVQTKLEQLARTHAKTLGDKLSSAILAVDHTSGEVVAYVGSAGYLDAKRLGAIDMIEAIRSPGSTLKPIIYALGFDGGIAHPETLIEDRPTRFGAYRPENFDQTYRGAVTIREALGQSLNIPAVRVLDAVGPQRFVSRLRKFKVTAELPDDAKPSLAVALGGIGMRVRDLASLYASFANGGQHVALTHIKGERERRILSGEIAADQKLELVSPLAAWYVSDILKDAPPPPNARRGAIAYKTGTSYGYRDAWAAGFDGRHTVVVWIGRADATSTPGLIGRTAAAPILFDAFSRISQVRTPLPSAPTSALRVSGDKLPPPLKRFGNELSRDARAAFKEPPVLIAFPPDRAIIEVENEIDFESTKRSEAKLTDAKPTGPPKSTLSPVVVKAEGGVLPLTWLVDGTPVAAPRNRRHLVWHPKARGFAKLTVIDAKGRADRVSVRVK